MNDFGINEMLELQKALQEKYKDKWEGISPEMAARRLNAQTPEETLRAHADYVLCNDGALEALEASANTLCEQLLAEAAGKDGVARPF